MNSEKVKEVFGENETPLLRFAFSMVRDEELAKDAVQDTFIKLLKQEEEPENISAWLYRVCRNLIIDQMRRSKKVVYHEQFAEISPGIEDDDKMEKNENIKQVQMAMSRLPEIEKTIVFLKFYEEKNYKEISLITGKSVSNVGFILHQAMKKMKDFYYQKNTLQKESVK